VRAAHGRRLLRRRAILDRSWRVLDQHGSRRRIDRADRVFERRTDDDDDARAADHEALDREKQAPGDSRAAEREIGQLLRQARVHIVQVRHAQRRGDHGADDAAFFVRVDRIVATGHGAPNRSQGQQGIERDLRERRTDLHAADQRRPQAAKHTQARHRHRLTEWIGDEIDLVPQRRQRADSMELAEGCAARLEERLGRDHQDAHG